MKASANLLKSKISKELKKREVEAKGIYIPSEDKEGNISLSESFTFYILLEDEYSMLKTWDIYHRSVMGCDKGYSDNLKAYYVRVGA